MGAAFSPAVPSAPAFVAADLDGTFLDDAKNVPQANLDALDELARRGIAFVPCTGRGVAGISQTLLDHPASKFAISANGAVVQEIVRDADGTGHVGAPLCEVAVSKEDALAVYEFSRGRKVTFDIFCDGRMLMNEGYVDILWGLPVDPREHALLRALRELTDAPSEELIQNARCIERVSCFWGYEEDLEAITSFVDARPSLAWARGAAHIVEITAAGATKGRAVEWLCGHLGVDASRAWAFGDSENDVSMLEFAGVGVALPNSMPPALDAADQICEQDNNAGGVGLHLLRMLG